MALPLGTILDGKFKIVQTLGEGGMGTVYKVEQIGTIPPYYYAVKELLINPNTSEEDRKAAIERFNKEIALLRGLKHPRIAALALPFQDRGNYYFAMEFVPGRSLEKVLEQSNGPLPEEQVINWMIQVCEALTYIHTRTPPIILRDLKPGNIMVAPDNEVQLIDFGIARRFDPTKRTNTENLGTISYASPEHLGSITAPGQKRTAQNPGTLVQTTARSDIYSLGATMYHLLTNYEPDPIQTPAPGSIRAKNPRLSAATEQVVIRAMQQLPDQRYQTAEQMRVALQNCLPGQARTVNSPVSTIQIPAMISPNSTIIVTATPATSTSSAQNAANQGLICSRCGLVNRVGAKFCAHDGQPLIQGVAIAPPQSRPATYRNAPILPRPSQRPINSRPILPRPAQQSTQARPQPIQPRPVNQSTQARPASTIKPQPAQTGNGTKSADSSATYRSGLQYLSNKNFAEAVNQFKLARIQGAPLYDVLYNLGRAYRQYGQVVKDTDKKLFTDNMKFAAEQFEEAVQQKPDAVDAFFQLGMCYRDLALYSQAAIAFQKARALTPKDSAIYYQLGMIALEQGSYQEAEERFKAGLRINPDHALIQIALGRLYSETRQVPTAITTLRKAVQIDPALWEGWFELGRAHMKNKEWRSALSALERARQLNPNIPELFVAMATCNLKLSKKPEARLLINEALQRDPNNAEALRLQKQL